METEFPSIKTATSDLARERLAEDVKTLIRDAEKLLEATADDLGDKTGDLRQRLKAAVERAKASYAGLEEQAKVSARRVDEIVRNHPYESMGVAFGVGVLLGVLINRR